MLAFASPTIKHGAAMKTIAKIIVSIVAFIVASGATYVAVKKWNNVEPVRASQHGKDTLDGVNGLSEGETVTLPQLTTLTGEKVNLGALKEERLLCVFIGSTCAGCARDAELWRDLKDESAKRGVAFYLVSIGDDLPELERFSSTYKFDTLPLLYDPAHKVGPQLKVGFLPQYVLFTRKGDVIHRWDGIRHYNKQGGSQQLAEFFQPHD